MVRQLEEELRMRMRGPSVEIQQQMEVLYNENEHLTREIAILRDTIKVSRELPSRISIDILVSSFCLVFRFSIFFLFLSTTQNRVSAFLFP